MNKQELLKITGNEEQSELAIEILLKQIKPEFMFMAIKADALLYRRNRVTSLISVK